MKDVILVFVGGGLGSGARFLAGKLLAGIGAAGFPVATLAVNVLGSFLLAFIAAAAARGHRIPQSAVLLLTTGVMGGFTTYSTFNYETIALFQQGRPLHAAANLAATLAGCAVAGILGMLAGSRLPG